MLLELADTEERVYLESVVATLYRECILHQTDRIHGVAFSTEPHFHSVYRNLRHLRSQ